MSPPTEPAPRAPAAPPAGGRPALGRPAPGRQALGRQARRRPAGAWSVGAVPSRVVLVAAAVLQLVVLYAPRAPSVATSVPHLDKLVHLTVFALVVWAARWAGVPRRRAVALLLAHAVASELVQHSVLPGRSGDPWDVLADAGGVLVGALVALPGRAAPRRGPA